MIKILDVCSGIGGFSLGLEATGGFDTVAFCEYDEFCRKVLNKHWPDVPIYKDLKEIGNEPTRLIQEFDLICGGVPCQPFSVAGKKKGKEDDRHLWPYMFKIIKHKKPTWVIVENVGGFVNVALDDVCLDLETEGYATQSFIIPACGVEAPHRRDRVWILGKLMGDTSSDGRSESKSSEKEGRVIEQSEERRVLESKGASDGGASDVDDSKRNEHIEEIGGGDGEEREDEKRQGEEDSTSRISSGASGLRVSDQGHETSEHVDNSKRLGLKEGSTQSEEFKGEKTSNQSNNSNKRRRERGSAQDVADTELKSQHDKSNGGSNLESQKERQKTRTTDGSSSGQDVADSSSKGSQGHRGEHGLRETSEEEQAFRGGEERDVSNTESIGSSSDNNSRSSTQQDREDRVQSESRGERSSEGTEDVSNSGGKRGRSGQTDRQDAKDVGELTGSQEHREGNAEPGLGGMVDGLSSRLDGHHGFEVEPDIPRVAENIPDRVNRLKALGNSIVPQIIYHIGMAILEEERK